MTLAHTRHDHIRHAEDYEGKQSDRARPTNHSNLPDSVRQDLIESGMPSGILLLAYATSVLQNRNDIFVYEIN